MSFRSQLLAAVTASKPYKRRLNYLTSSGTQYIDLGVYPADTDRWRIDFGQPMTATSAIRAVFGTRDGGSSNSNLFFQSGGSTSPRMDFGNDNYSFITPSGGITSLEIRDKVLYVNDEAVHTFTASYTTPTQTALLFSAHSNSSGGVATGAICSIARFRYWVGGTTLVQDLIPVLDNSLVACMYDQVTGQFFYNAGTGDFIAPRTWEERELAYLQPTSSQWMDTGITCDDCSKFEIEYSSSDTNYGVGCLFGTAQPRTFSTYFGLATMVSTKQYVYAGGVYSLDYNFLLETKYKAVCTKSLFSLYSDDGTLLATATPGTISSDRSLYIFAGNEGTTTPTASEKSNNFRLFSIKMWNNSDALVRNFTPMLDESGVPCLYDSATQTYFYNQGSGSFLYAFKNI